MKLDDIEEMIENLFHLRFVKLDAFRDGATFKHDHSSPAAKCATSDWVSYSTFANAILNLLRIDGHL
jgi:hypothetical protein